MYDLIIIGAGPAGMAAAECAAKNNLKTALIEKNALGGTCLNCGCIPTKTYLNTTGLFNKIKKAKNIGVINTEAVSVDFSLINKQKEELLNRLRGGLEFFVKAQKIDLFKEAAEMISPNQIKLASAVLEGKHILIAAGSYPKELPAIKFDGKKIISSTEALNLTSLPNNILIIGGGVIGCEFAEIFSSLGVKVEIVEVAEGLLSGIDREAARKIETVFKKKGVKVSVRADPLRLDFNLYEKILLCVGRSADTDFLKDFNINKERGRIIVNDYLQTSFPNIYAAGDCIGGYQLAHAASYEGRLVVRNILNGNKEKADYRVVPFGVYTSPEIASCGLSEEVARKNFTEVHIRRLDFLKLGMSYVIDEPDGFIKIITDGADNILGASIIGPKATEIIHVLTLAIKNSVKASQIRDTIFAHPTISEGILEALL